MILVQIPTFDPLYADHYRKSYNFFHAVKVRNSDCEHFWKEMGIYIHLVS